MDDIEAKEAVADEDPGELLDLANKHYDRRVSAWAGRIQLGPPEDDRAILFRTGDIR